MPFQTSQWAFGESSLELAATLPECQDVLVAVVGMAVILRNSYWAKRRFIRAQYARPKFFYPFRRLMRRTRSRP